MSEAKLLKTYLIDIPEVDFIGRCYHDEDRKNGTYGYLWGMWFEQNLFRPIETLIEDPTFIEEGNAYIGLCRIREHHQSEYWIGMFVPKGTKCPAGYEKLEIPASEVAVNYVYGKEPEIYFYSCLEAMQKLGYEWKSNNNDERIMAERYVYPRFTNPDQEGNKILDLMYFINVNK